MPEAIEVGVRMVDRGNWAFAQYLPREATARALGPHLAAIAKAQQKTGLWFKKNAEAYSVDILKGLAKAFLIDDLVERRVLRYDPVQPFAESADEWGFLVRRVTNRPAKQDAALQKEIVSRYAREQCKDGSWGGTVAGTALVAERLLELGVAPYDPVLRKSADWLLDQFVGSVERSRPNSSLCIQMEHVFTTGDCGQEHAATGRFLMHHQIAPSCFLSLPIIQTALALRSLVLLGHESHPNVKLAFDSLLDIQTGYNHYTEQLPPIPVGHWCAHQCRFKLEEREKARRRSGAVPIGKNKKRDD